MSGIRVDIVVGTRPEAIKMAPVAMALRANCRFSVRIVATGQHTDMLDQALNYFELAADENLRIMKEAQSLDYITSSVLVGVGELFDRDVPDAVLVHGDTTTTFASALAAFYRKIPVGHVEAGLRSGDIYRPYPEEMNRLLADRISRWFFAPTEGARQNLLREGADESAIIVTGNTVVDALHETARRVREPNDAALRGVIGGEKFLLVTAHRRESWGEPLEGICRALLRILDAHPEQRAIVPMHKNPLVRDTMTSILGSSQRIVLCDPLDYPDFVWAMDNCSLILSDSGGVQEEATALRKAVLILRDVTERPEAVECGSGILVGTDEARIFETADELLSDEKKMAGVAEKCADNPFGDGKASERIACALESLKDCD